MKQRLDYNLIKWAEYFTYDLESPSGLYWINTCKIAGTRSKQNKNNYSTWSVKLFGVSYLVHRIIWVMLKGSISKELVLDHLDGVSTNNNINNLAEKLQKSNTQNRGKQLSNSSGFTGVALKVTKDNFRYWRARWVSSTGVQKEKYFSVTKIGEAGAIRQAIDYRELMLRSLNREGAEYTERHGT